MMLLLLLLLSPTVCGERVKGVMKDGACVCSVDPALWAFPADQYKSVQQQLDSCEVSVENLSKQVQLSSDRLPYIQSVVANVTARLEPHQYLRYKGLYSALGLRQLSTEIKQLETHVSSAHSQLNNAQTRALTKEVGKLSRDVNRIKMTDDINLKTIKEQVRYLKNRAESCKSIPFDFRGMHQYCTKGLIKNISEPVVTKISPYGKSLISGSWGKQALKEYGGLAEEETEDSYWVQPLTNSHIYGNVLRVYPTYDNFMASTNHKDYTFASSNTHPNAIEGPSAVLHGKGFYYHCYRSEEICRYDLTDNNIKRVKLPGTGVGNNNKFPYCYYDCRSHSDIDIEADETGLWAIYATMGNHGNVVVSRIIYENETLNVTQTWETQVFKKAVTNAFMVCGVLYLTRFNNDYREEVYYAFDTATGRENSNLAMPLEKVAKGVASLSYNPTDRKLYMYNDGYLLAYQASF